MTSTVSATFVTGDHLLYQTCLPATLSVGRGDCSLTVAMDECGLQSCRIDTQGYSARARSRWKRAIGMMAVTAAFVATAVGLFASIARLLPVDGHVVVVLAALSWCLAVAAPLGVVVSVLCRQWLLATVAAVLALAAVVAEA